MTVIVRFHFTSLCMYTKQFTVINATSVDMRVREFLYLDSYTTKYDYSSTCHERTPSGPGKSVRTMQVAAHQRDGWERLNESGH